MSNMLYDVARVDLLLGQLEWPDTDLVVTAWSGTPTFVPADATTGDIAARGNTLRGTSLPIGGTAVTVDGTAQSDAVVIPLVPIGPDVTWFTMSKLTGRLILFADDVEGVPFVANGLDIVVQPDWITARGWFRP